MACASFRSHYRKVVHKAALSNAALSYSGMRREGKSPRRQECGGSWLICEGERSGSSHHVSPCALSTVLLLGISNINALARYVKLRAVRLRCNFLLRLIRSQAVLISTSLRRLRFRSSVRSRIDSTIITPHDHVPPTYLTDEIERTTGSHTPQQRHLEGALNPT